MNALIRGDVLQRIRIGSGLVLFAFAATHFLNHALGLIHLETMLRVSRAGAVVLPASPGSYHRPQSMDDLFDFIVGRILSHLGVPHGIGPRWQAGE